MEEYRWNAEQLAHGYNVAAQRIHPYYEEIQDKILDLIEHLGSKITLVDAGGGSGRLLEKFLCRCPASRAILIDQSKSFLNLARQRLQRFGDRARVHAARLQDDWSPIVDQPHAIVSMSAIHHLESAEKRELYERLFLSLAPNGVFINGDEIRANDDAVYLKQCKAWAAHMHVLMDQQQVPESIYQPLLQWEARNVDGFGIPKSSGDDCHETIEVQCGYLKDAGFASVAVPWQKEMWAIFKAVKSDKITLGSRR